MDRQTIDEIVGSWAQEIEQNINDGDVDANEAHDAIFEAVDSGWGELGFPVGRIDEWPINPGGKTLILLGEVLDYCEEEAWLEDDKGLWDGLQGAATLASQAFFSLENVLWEKLRKKGVIE